MSRSPFGWDLPPGCTHRMIEEASGGDPAAEPIITWSKATAQSLIDGEPDELFQPASEEFSNALEAAIERGNTVIHIQITE